MTITRGTFLSLCQQSVRLCALSQTRAWVNPEDVKTFTTARSTALLAHVFSEDEEHSIAFWDVEGRRIPLLMRSTRLHELHTRKANP